jgi:hypothetical protein
VAAIAKGIAMNGFSLKLKLLALAAVAAAVTGFGLASMPIAAGPQLETPPAQKRSAPMEPTGEARQKESTAEPEIRRDQFDDLLPKRAIARLGSSRFRHGGHPFGAPAFSADGRQVASASLSGVYVFDVATGRLIQHIRLPDTFHPRMVRFLGDGKRIAVAAGDWEKAAELTVYDLADGQASARSEFQGKGQVFVIDFNADASQILVEDRFTKVFLWGRKGVGARMALPTNS